MSASTSTALSTLLPLNGNSISIDANTAPATVLGDHLLRLTRNQPIVIQNATRTVSGSSVIVTGKTSLLNVVDMPVTATATSTSTGVVLSLRFTLIDGQATQNSWRFSRSFPTLPLFNIGSGSKEEDTAPANSNLLDRLVLSDAAFVLTTIAENDSVTGAPVQPGFNFVSRCTPTGMIGMLGSLLTGGGSVLLYGPIHIPAPAELTVPVPALPLLKFPWQMSQLAPGIHLLADLGIDKQIGNQLRLHSTGLRIYSPDTQSWADANPTYSPVTAAVAKLEVPSASISLDLTAASPGSLDSLSFFGNFEGFSVGNLSHLLDLSGGDDLAAQLPSDMQGPVAALNKLSLQAMSLGLGKNFSIDSVGIEIGLPGINTKVLPGLTVTDISAYFNITQPFSQNRGLWTTLGGNVDFLGAPFAMNVTLPGPSAVAVLKESATLPLSSLFREFGLPAPADLTINAFQLEVDGDGSLSAATVIAEKPSWTLDLGPVPLTIANVVILADRPAKGSATASISGIISLSNSLELAVQYQTPGDFMMRADLPEVQLSELISKLSNQSVKLPSQFDLDFVDGNVLIQKSGSNFVFQFATTMQDLGTVAFEARRTSGGQNTWGFAAGVDLKNLHLSSLPGLSALKPFEDFFSLDELMLVVSSFADPGFVFPSLAVFNSPTIRAGNLKLPAQAGGVISGLNAYARWTLDTSKREHKMLQQFLGLNPTLGITLQMGFDPSRESRLYVSYSTKVQGHPLDCRFGGQISSGQIGVFLTGTFRTAIQSHPVQFDVTALLVSTGMFVSGTMQGSVTFEDLTLSNLALVIGVDWYGIPSLGVAATLTVSRFQSSLAVFFDSTQPSRSMLAGSLSDLSLKDVLDTFAGNVVPSPVDKLLSQVALVGTSEFNLPLTVASALDKMQIDEVSAAFSAQGITIPATSSQVLLVVSKPGACWFITNMTNLFHYELVKTGNSIRVRLNPQFFLVPQTTYLGALQFNQGTFINTAIQVLSFHAMAKILIMPSQGISVDGSMSRIVIGTESLFSIESADGTQGPKVSAATFNQPSMKDATLRGPHFLIDGRLNLLGLTLKSYISLSSNGFIFDIKDTPQPAFTYEIRGHFNGPGNMGAGGSLIYGVKQGMVDFGPLGKINLNADVNASLDAGVEGSKIWARFSGGFEFGGEKLSLPALNLDVTTKSLAALSGKMADMVKAAIREALNDSSRWARWIGNQTVNGVADMGNELKTFFKVTSPNMAAQLMKTAKQDATVIANSLSKTYQQGANDIASTMRSVGYGANEVGNALKGIGVTSATAIAEALNSAGYKVNEVGDYIKDTFRTGPDELKNVLEQAHFPTNQIQGYFNSLGGDFKKAFDSVTDTAQKAAGTVVDTAKKGADTVANTAGKAGSAVEDTGKKAAKGIKKLFGG